MKRLTDTFKGMLLIGVLAISVGVNIIALELLTGHGSGGADTAYDIYIPADEEQDPDSWDIFTLAVAWQESRWDTNAVGSRNDVGILQITPVIVKDANRILGNETYTLDDRYDIRKSIEMFNIIQDKYNPEHDRHLALKIWNPGASVSYHTRIMNIYDRLLGERFFDRAGGTDDYRDNIASLRECMMEI